MKLISKMSSIQQTNNTTKKLSREFYNRDTGQVAEELLGKLLVHRVDGCERIGRIVEVEAYLGPHDLAAHTSKGITPRTRVMYGPPGHAYVYLIYGMHHCMNVVTQPDGTGAGVLLRAIEPVQNISGNTRGPGLVCRAMGIDRSNYGHDLCSDDLYLAAPTEPGVAVTVVRRPRVGVDYAGQWATEPLRFYIEGNKYISKK
jgi:DNA-3-methyladenine glycosylase